MGATAIKYARKKPVIPFRSVWNTRNISDGSSTANQITLPLHQGGLYNFTVNWGDGTEDRITSHTQPEILHTYTTAGVYEITIKGTLSGWQFNNMGDRLKILSVAAWGCFRPGNLGYYFYGCTNLNLSDVSDVLNLKGTTTMRYMFALCSSLTSVNRISEWNTGEVTDFNALFWTASVFNQSVNNWDTSKVTDMSYAFQKAALFNQPLDNWDLSLCTSIYQIF